jgi:uncharacterized protein (TIGR03437 family)
MSEIVTLFAVIYVGGLRRLMKLLFTSLLCAAALSITVQTVKSQSILGGNLIVNGNAEAGLGGTATTVVTSIPGWTRAGNANVLPYGLTGYVLLSDPTPAPPPYGPGPGFQYFIGASSSTLTQNIDVSSGASIIAGGNVKFTASAYLGARAGGGASAPQMTVAFQNASGQPFSTASVGAAGFDGEGMSLQQQIGLVPVGTARIAVTLTLNNSNAVADGLSLVLSTLGTSPGSVLGTNLVVNGNAEAGPGVPDSSTALYVPGWSTANSASVAPYGGTGWILLSDPGPADRGVNLFTGSRSTNSGSTMYQDIDVSPAATSIDAGQVTYEVSAWLGTTGGADTSGTLTYTFFNWSGTQVGTTATLGPARHSGTGLVETSHAGFLPSGTRRVHIALSLPGDGYLADDIAFTLAAPSGPPVITPGGIVSGGAFGGFSSIAPGSWIEIYGTNLTTSAPLGWSGSQFINGVAPTQVGDVTVSIGGQAAFIDYISSGQVNALVPSTAPLGSVEVTLTNSQGTSDGFPIYVDQTRPGLLAPGSFVVSGKQYAGALFSDGQTFALPANAISGVPSRPARVGETLTVYGVGFGAVTPSIAAGTVVTGQNALTTPIQVLFGTTPATLTYYGLAPSFTGLYQFNVVVPNVAVNDAEPISFSLGGVKGSQTLYIAVQK